MFYAICQEIPAQIPPFAKKNAAAFTIIVPFLLHQSKEYDKITAVMT